MKKHGTYLLGLTNGPPFHEIINILMRFQRGIDPIVKADTAGPLHGSRTFLKWKR